MYNRVRINGDMNTWTLYEDLSPEQLTESDQPLALQVASPLTGVLLLSVTRAASVTLLPDGPLDPRGWIPGDAVPPPQLCLPLANEATEHHNRYTLEGNVNTDTLQSQIKDAMATGSRLTVPVGVDVDGQACAVVLNGATLPFVVITGPPPR
jgi:hypothetical protein